MLDQRCGGSRHRSNSPRRGGCVRGARLISLAFSRSAVAAYKSDLTSGPNLAAIRPCDARILTFGAEGLAQTQRSPPVRWIGRGQMGDPHRYLSVRLKAGLWQEPSPRTNAPAPIFLNFLGYPAPDFPPFKIHIPERWKGNLGNGLVF